MKQLLDALKTKLDSDQTAGSFYTAMANGKYFLEQAPQDLAPPFMVYSVIDCGQEYGYGNEITHVMRVQFDIYAAMTDSSWATYEPKLYALINGNTLTPTDYDRGNVFFITRAVPSVDEDLRRIMSEAEIRGTDH